MSEKKEIKTETTKTEKTRSKSPSANMKFRLNVNEIHIEKDLNFRDELRDVDELAKQIAENGQIKAVVVRKKGDKFYLVDGHRRFEAIKKAKKEYKYEPKGDVMCEMERPGITDKDRIFDMILSNDGQKFTDFELAKGFARLCKMGWEVVDIANKLGKSIQYVHNKLALNEASETIREEVKNKTLSTSAAAKLVKMAPAKQKQIITAAKKSSSGKLRVNDVEMETRGTTNTVSTKKIRDAIKQIAAAKEKLPKNDETPYLIQRYDDILLGLDIALGKEELPDLANEQISFPELDTLSTSQEILASL